jgi:hypothetical protein
VAGAGGYILPYIEEYRRHALIKSSGGLGTKRQKESKRKRDNMKKKGNEKKA